MANLDKAKKSHKVDSAPEPKAKLAPKPAPVKKPATPHEPHYPNGVWQKSMSKKYTVIKDTREKDGWFFSEYNRCAGMDIGTLHTGDYTIKGFEDVVCIERKACASEIAMNLGRKKKAFQAEIERMRDYEFSFIVCEFSMEDVLKFPEGSRVPRQARSNVRITGKYLLKCLMEFQIWYDTKIIFCGNKGNAFLVCDSIFKRLNELFHMRDKDGPNQETAF